MMLKDFLTKDKWCQWSFALDDQGELVLETHPRACKWCLVGAIHKCYQYPETKCMVVEKLSSLIGNQSLIEFNDTHTWNEIKALIERANV